MIEVRGLSKRYGGTVAVDALSFDRPLAAGNAIPRCRVDEVLAIVGYLGS